MKLVLPQLPINKCIVLALLMMMAAVAAVYVKPTFKAGSAQPDLATLVPTSFGGWTEKTDINRQVSLSVDGERSTDQPYDQTMLRTYVNASGDEVMLALAYAHEQKQDIKIHRPEVCYVAQGYQLLSKSEATFFLSPNMPEAAGKRLLAKREGFYETVSYWVRIGEQYPQGGFDARMVIFRDGLKGQIDDGILVRASMTFQNESDAPMAYRKQEAFLADLVRTVNLTSPGVLTPHSTHE